MPKEIPIQRDSIGNTSGDQTAQQSNDCQAECFDYKSTDTISRKREFEGAVLILSCFLTKLVHDSPDLREQLKSNGITEDELREVFDPESIISKLESVRSIADRIGLKLSINMEYIGPQ